MKLAFEEPLGRPEFIPVQNPPPFVDRASERY
jgi:hypothetical protein